MIPAYQPSGRMRIFICTGRHPWRASRHFAWVTGSQEQISVHNSGTRQHHCRHFRPRPARANSAGPNAAGEPRTTGGPDLSSSRNDGLAGDDQNGMGNPQTGSHAKPRPPRWRKLVTWSLSLPCSLDWHFARLYLALANTVFVPSTNCNRFFPAIVGMRNYHATQPIEHTDCRFGTHRQPHSCQGHPANAVCSALLCIRHADRLRRHGTSDETRQQDHRQNVGKRLHELYRHLADDGKVHALQPDCGRVQKAE